MRGTHSAVNSLFALSPHPLASRRILRVCRGSFQWVPRSSAGGEEGERSSFFYVSILGHLGLYRDLFRINGGVISVLGASERTGRVEDRAHFGRLFVYRLAVYVTNQVRCADAYVYRIDRGADRLRAVRGFSDLFADSFRTRDGRTAEAIERVFLDRFVVLITLRSTVICPFRFQVCFRPFHCFLHVFAIAQRARVWYFRSRIRRGHVLQ